MKQKVEISQVEQNICLYQDLGWTMSRCSDESRCAGVLNFSVILLYLDQCVFPCVRHSLTSPLCVTHWFLLKM